LKSINYQLTPSVPDTRPAGAMMYLENGAFYGKIAFSRTERIKEMRGKINK